MGSKVLVSLSGGMDSATMLGQALHEGHKVDCVSFVYTSKHNRYENDAAVRLITHYKVPLRVLDLRSVISHFKSDLLLSGGEVPEGHYEEENMRRTVVPGRNAIFISILAGLASSEGMDEVWIGCHAGDHAIYPDCRPGFIACMDNAITSAYNVGLLAPFIYKTKKQILKRGLELKVPYELTRTCYKDQADACGKCGSCQERLEAFAGLGVEDPIPYESRELMPKKGA